MKVSVVISISGSKIPTLPYFDYTFLLQFNHQLVGWFFFPKWVFFWIRETGLRRQMGYGFNDEEWFFLGWWILCLVKFLIFIFSPDCIGSAFNAKGAMQCPNCRKVEKGQWLYASGHHRSFTEFSMEDWTYDEDLYDSSYSEMVIWWINHNCSFLFFFLMSLYLFDLWEI